MLLNACSLSQRGVILAVPTLAKTCLTLLLLLSTSTCFIESFSAQGVSESYM